jgi:hypothetical protein
MNEFPTGHERIPILLTFPFGQGLLTWASMYAYVYISYTAKCPGVPLA